MIIKVFVDWREQKIFNESEHNERVQKMIEMTKDDESLFMEWLNEHYTAYYIWRMTAKERIAIQKSWEEECRINAINDSNFEEVEIEI